MDVKNGISACPHCGGTNGFITNIVFDAVRVYSWDKGDIDTDNYSVRTETKPRCMDYGKSVRSVMRQALPAQTGEA